jgi:hypothetical protein
LDVAVNQGEELGSAALALSNNFPQPLKQGRINGLLLLPDALCLLL